MSRRRREVEVEDEAEDVQTPTQVEAEDMDVDEDDSLNPGDELIQQTARKLVRYALACDVSRTPMRRQDISNKVMPSASRSKNFRQVFDAAQAMLNHTFGMEMVELPKAEKLTQQQKRAAQRSEKSAPTSSNAWILTSILPDKFRTDEILSPARAPTAEQEATYQGFYLVIVSLLYFSGGNMSEMSLNRHLRRLGIMDDTPLDRTDKVLQRCIKDGYIVKVKDTQGDEELVTYYVGPRGKAEVGPTAARKTFKMISPDNEQEELEAKLDTSLAWTRTEDIPATQASKPRGRQKKTRTDEHDTQNNDDEEDDLMDED